MTTDRGGRGRDAPADPDDPVPRGDADVTAAVAAALRAEAESVRQRELREGLSRLAREGITEDQRATVREMTDAIVDRLIAGAAETVEGGDDRTAADAARLFDLDPASGATPDASDGTARRTDDPGPGVESGESPTREGQGDHADAASLSGVGADDD